MPATSKRISVSLVLRLLSVFLALSLLGLCLNGALPSKVQAATAAWASLGAMTGARYSHTTTLLLDGKVLVAGGKDNVGALRTTNVYDPIMNVWGTAGDMIGVRYAHSASLLQSGKVLVVGGRNDTEALVTTELYNPVTNSWTAGTALDSARSDHTATMLSNGTVLVIGGKNSAGEALNNVVLYTPAASGPGAWIPKKNLTTARYAHTATLLSDGRVLVVGGKNTAGDSLTDVTIYDPATNTWADDALDLTDARADHTTVSLRTGKVLVMGGESKELVSEVSTIVYRNTSVLYDPAANTWTSTAVPMNAARSKHTATLTPLGNVLVVGGLNDVAILAGAEIYDPLTDAWSDAGNMSSGRQLHGAVLLPFGDVLVLGGNNGTDPLNTVDLFRPAVTGTWTPVLDSMGQIRYSQQATILLDGRVLITGGQSSSDILDNADIYDPVTGKWVDGVHSMLSARIGHTMTLLPDGRVLVVGGQTVGTGVFLASAEIYDPKTNTWTPTNSMNVARVQHTATLLPDGRVLVVGGYDKYIAHDTTEVYNPATGVWQNGGNIDPARFGHTATLMADDRVLIVGGQNYFGYVAQTQLYIPSESGYSWWKTSKENLTLREGHASILLPNGMVLVAGGNDQNGASLNSCELYDSAGLLLDPPAPWKLTGPLNKARTSFSMTLLPDGKVMAVGGFLSEPTPEDKRSSSLLMRGVLSGTSLPDVEIYDPLSGAWTTVASLNEARRSPTATLLPNGQVFVAAGFNGVPSNTSELYDMFGNSGFSSAWRPTLADIPAQKYHKPLSISGTQFRGFQFGEGAGGATSGSATNYPLLQLRRIDNHQVRWLPLDAKTGFSDTLFPSISLSDLLSGPSPVVVTVYVNGIPSEFKAFKIDLLKNYFPLLQRGGANKKIFVPVAGKK